MEDGGHTFSETEGLEDARGLFGEADGGAEEGYAEEGHCWDKPCDGDKRIEGIGRFGWTERLSLIVRRDRECMDWSEDRSCMDAQMKSQSPYMGVMVRAQWKHRNCSTPSHKLLMRATITDPRPKMLR